MKQKGVEEVSLVGESVTYLGEGNANLVVAIRDKDLVIRFPKSKFAEKCQDEKLKAISSYLNLVIRPLLGDRFLNPVSVVKISLEDLELVKKKVRVERPMERCVKDIFYPMGILMTDLTRPSQHFSTHGIGSTISVELKPKMGFLLPENCSHPSLCNFCLKQFYKVEQGITDTLSGYCPLDLFSGNKIRMFSAIKALMRSPQNNMRIFGDGTILHGKESTEVPRCSKLLSQVFENEDVLAQVLVTALISEYRPDTVHTVNPNEFNPTASPHLSSKLLAVEESQKSFSVKSEQQCTVEEDLTSSSHPNTQTKRYCKANCDIIICSDPAGSNLCRQNRSDESMNNPPRDNRKPVQKRVCYSKPDTILKKNCGAKRLDSEDELTPGSVLHTILELQRMNSITDRQAQDILESLIKEGQTLEDLQNLVIQPAEELGTELVSESIQLLRNYILYATAKDLSIFITLRKLKNPKGASLPKITVNNQTYCFSIKIIDLDPKHVHRISKYVSQKKEWLRSCTQTEYSPFSH